MGNIKKDIVSIFFSFFRLILVSFVKFLVFALDDLLLNGFVSRRLRDCVLVSGDSEFVDDTLSHLLGTPQTNGRIVFVVRKGDESALHNLTAVRKHLLGNVAPIHEAHHQHLIGCVFLLGTSIGVDGELEVLLEGGSGDGVFHRVNEGEDIIVLTRTGILHLLHEGEFGRIKGAEADVFFGEGGKRHCRELYAFLLSKKGNQFLSVMIE